SGATSTLEREFRAFGDPLAVGRGMPDSARRIMEVGLNARGQRAITGTLFAPHAAKDRSSLSYIRRVISERYTAHQMEECEADILTNIPGLGAFNQLSRCFPLYDYALFNFLFQACYGTPDSTTEFRRIINRAVETHGTQGHAMFLLHYERLIVATLHPAEIA